jgi:hypothetical protein
VAAPTFSLSIHADYRCRHSGACCTAGWEIPVELYRQPIVGAATLTTAGGCRFFDTDDDRLCAIHRDHGYDAMPMACQQFPRRVLLDDRGVHVSLSHFCPTAAAMLFRDDVPLEIVADPPAFPRDGYYEGLDARGSLPPSLVPDVLMDFESYAAWERECIRLLARDDWSVERAFGAIRSATAALSRWRPGDVPLVAAVVQAFERFRDPAGPIRDDISLSRPLRFYAAAKLFASWTAYNEDRLSAVVAFARGCVWIMRSMAEDVARESGRPLQPSDLLETIQKYDHARLHRVIEDRSPATSA